MGQDEIYRVLLELKETAGKTEAGIEDIKKSIVEQSINHDKLRDEHDLLKESHNSLKSRVLLVSGFIGAIFGGLATWVKTTFFS